MTESPDKEEPAAPLTLRVGAWVISRNDLTSIDNNGWNRLDAPAGTPGLVAEQRPAGSHRYGILFPGAVLLTWQRPADLTPVHVRVEVLATA